MTVIQAKPVIKDRYWILTKDDHKVGAVEAESDGYVVRIKDRIARYKTLRILRKHINIDFCAIEKSAKPSQDEVYGYNAGCRTHNAMWHVHYRLPLFTKTEKSRSWFAAGWYLVKQHRSWRVMQNPKLIVLERYPFQGPFKSRDEACVDSKGQAL